MIQLYQGGFQLVKRSGVGQALLHQEQVLKAIGIPVTRKYSKKADVIHINTILPDSFFRAALAHLLGQKVIYYAHSTKEDFKNSFSGSNVLAPLFKKWIIHCYNQGDLILTPTEYSKSLLETYGLKRPLMVLSNGVNTEYFKPDVTKRNDFRIKYGLPKEQKVVISVGHLMDRKGIVEFMNLARKMPEITFIWFGFTPKKLITRKVTDALSKKPENLILAGFVEQEELLCAYQAADVFAFLSKEETEGIVVLEALASGIPTVLCDIPVYQGWLEKDRQVYKAENEQEIFRCVQRALQEVTPSMTMAGRKVAEERDFRHIGIQLQTFYQAV